MARARFLRVVLMPHAAMQKCCCINLLGYEHIPAGNKWPIANWMFRNQPTMGHAGNSGASDALRMVAGRRTQSQAACSSRADATIAGCALPACSDCSLRALGDHAGPETRNPRFLGGFLNWCPGEDSNLHEVAPAST